MDFDLINNNNITTTNVGQSLEQQFELATNFR